MVQYRILVSSYTDLISTLLFDDAAGTLEVTAQIEVGYHPSWITYLSGNDKSIVFTGLEQSEGTILALKFDDEGKGVVIAKADSGGKDPCCLLATNREILVANYSSGTVGFIPLSEVSPYIGPSSAVKKIKLTGSGPNKARQEAPHPHQVTILDELQELFVPDLGTDRVYRFKPVNGSWVLQGHIQYEPGGGPRHVAYYDGELFTVLELSNKLVRHKLPRLPALPKFVTSTPTISFPPPQPNNMLAAEILIPKPNTTYPTPYVYVSNRNDASPEGDTIAIFDFQSDPEKLNLVSEVRTGLKHVRGMVFGGRHDMYLVVGGVNGGGVKIFERTEGGKGLREIARNEHVLSPTGFLWK